MTIEGDDPVSSPTLRIAVVGVGGIGSTFAFQLARQGRHEVTAIARPGSARLQHLQRDNAIVDIKGQRADVFVGEVLDEQVPYDLILVTLLAHQVDRVLPGLQRSPAKRIQFMFNNFEPERIRDAVGAERCSFGMPFVQATVDENGRLNAKIGAAGQKSKMNHRGHVEIFNAAGLPAIFEPDMLLWLRCHVPLGAAFESVCVAGMRRGGGASWRESMLIARGMQEAFTLIQRLGYRLYPRGKVTTARQPGMDLGQHAVVRVAHPIVSETSLYGRKRVSRLGRCIDSEYTPRKSAGLGGENQSDATINLRLGFATVRPRFGELSGVRRKKESIDLDHRYQPIS